MEHTGKIVAKDKAGHVLGGEECDCKYKSDGGISVSLTFKSEEQLPEASAAKQCLEWVCGTVQQTLDKPQTFSAYPANIGGINVNVSIFYNLLDPDDLERKAFMQDVTHAACECLRLPPPPPSTPSILPPPLIIPPPLPPFSTLSPDLLSPCPSPLSQPPAQLVSLLEEKKETKKEVQPHRRPRRDTGVVGPVRRTTRAEQRRVNAFNSVQTRGRAQKPQ